jgi:DNA repair exonuclease SbcCD ATPase subunit
LRSTALAKRMSEISPERPISKGSTHRRMQSLQPGTVRDLSLLLENGQAGSNNSPRSTEKNNRPSTPNRTRDYVTDGTSIEREVKSTSGPIISHSLTPIVRPTVRRPPQSILGENTPPQSATMLALQTMSLSTPKEGESPLSNITNSSTALVKAPQPVDALSNQIITLTNIATSLQKEMSQLSRRSRDNATDLVSLKEATNARDEDIRKSLRELIGNISDATSRSSSRDPFGTGLYIDNKPHGSPISKPGSRPFSLPRIPSPNSFATSIDQESTSTPSLCGPDTPSIITLLEKITQDMATRDGQENLLERLESLARKLSGLAPGTKIDELREMLSSHLDQDIVPTRGSAGSNHISTGSRHFNFDPLSRQLELGYDQSRSPMTQRAEKLLQDREGQVQSANPGISTELRNDMMKVIKSVKDSVAQGGGLTAEVKALVRELRGEVLGMGREIGRRLDEVNSNNTKGTDSTPTNDEVIRTVNEAVENINQKIDHIAKEHRRQIAALVPLGDDPVDYNEIYNALRTALKDFHASHRHSPDLRREDVAEAVKDAWENYKPEIEIQQLGLEREDVLACIKEGLQDYARSNERLAGASRDDVFAAVIEGLQHFTPPQENTGANLSRNEILDAVRECLEEFEFPVAPSAINAELTREDMMHAVQQVLSGFDFQSASAIVPHTEQNADVVSLLRDMRESIREEFKAVSEEAKQNVAANGRDTEQVLDATKDGLENLRHDIEAYINNVSGTVVQDEFQRHFLKTLNFFKEEVASLVANACESSQTALETRMESLKDIVNSSMVPAAPQSSQREILEALRDGLDNVKAEMHRPLAGTTEVLDALHEGLGDLRISIDKIANKPTDLTANDEILDALKSGLGTVRSDIDALREQRRNDGAVATVSSGEVVPAEMLKHDDIKNLEVLITQLRIKVESMGTVPEFMSKDDATRMEEALRQVQETVEGINIKGSTSNSDGASREDVQAIETILRNTKARLDDLIDGEQAVRKDQIDAIGTIILETQEAIGIITSQVEGIARRDDLTILESLISQVSAGFEEMKERAMRELEDPTRVTKTDVDAIETICLEVKSIADQIIKNELPGLSSKEDLKSLEVTLNDMKDAMTTNAEANSKALDDRQAEIVGVSERITEVKTFLQEFQEMLQSKLDDGATGVEAVGKVLEGMGETISQNATISQDLKDMFDSIKSEFEESKAGVVGAKLDADEKLQQATDILSAKVDERVSELILRYDELQVSLDERAKACEVRDAEIEAAVLGTRVVSEDLKSLVDTLGSAVTDSMEKVEEASKTVFDRVEELISRTNGSLSENKIHHQQTLDQVKHTINGIEAVQGQISDFHPKILEAIKDVLLIVGQHYDYSKTSATDIQERIEMAKPHSQPGPPLLPPVEKYDDTGVHEKLDKLVDHTVAAGEAFSQLDTLSQVHRQVMMTATDISDFLAAQKQRITSEHDENERMLHETTISLERRREEKNQVGLTVQELRKEAEALRDVIKGLKIEQESLTRKKTRLTADVSSLETALRLRREELHDMESRAELLERRILDGVVDHSRVLLMAKSNKVQDKMSRKRVHPRKNKATAETEPPSRPAVNIALSTNRSLVLPNAATQSRRILSLGQITHNVPSGGIQRSQSVRDPGRLGKSARKGSWGGSLAKRYGDLDKENHLLKESDEENDNDTADPKAFRATTRSPSSGDPVSDTETLRRTSGSTTMLTITSYDDAGTDLSISDDEDSRSEWAESALDASSTIISGDGNELVVYGK